MGEKVGLLDEAMWPPGNFVGPMSRALASAREVWSQSWTVDSSLMPTTTRYGTARSAAGVIVNGADMPISPLLNDEVRAAVSSARACAFTGSYPRGQASLV